MAKFGYFNDFQWGEFKPMSQTETILAQLPTALANLRRADQLWYNLKNQSLPVNPVVTYTQQRLVSVDWDLLVCGGTLGILLACALQLRGFRVAVLERGILRGREQEWNISRRELAVLIELGVLTAEELEIAIATQYNPARIQFHGGSELWVKDILNLGIDPIYLLETLKNRFLAAGGAVFENTPFESATIHPNGVEIQASEHQFSGRLLLDAMGHFSPISRQARQGKKPDAVCLVVGSCARGYPNSQTGDLIVSFTPILHQCQYFWEAFPARDGRTTYLFTYLDADPERFSLEFLFEEYLRLLPEYQQIELESLTWQRALFGMFPCYQNSPLQTLFDRILPIGDSSGSQSPLSFGGFGAMIRHLQRLTQGIEAALNQDLLDAKSLASLQPYQPNLSVTWLFQKAMSVEINQEVPGDRINNLLIAVFAIMQQLGDEILHPFLQDVVQFEGLTQTLLTTAIHHPTLVAKIIPQVGIGTLLNWLTHYGNLGLYRNLYAWGQKVSPLLKHLSPQQQYTFYRLLEAWQYGSGQDYQQHGFS